MSPSRFTIRHGGIIIHVNGANDLASAICTIREAGHAAHGTDPPVSTLAAASQIVLDTSYAADRSTKNRSIRDTLCAFRGKLRPSQNNCLDQLHAAYSLQCRVVPGEMISQGREVAEPLGTDMPGGASACSLSWRPDRWQGAPKQGDATRFIACGGRQVTTDLVRRTAVIEKQRNCSTEAQYETRDALEDSDFQASAHVDHKGMQGARARVDFDPWAIAAAESGIFPIHRQGRRRCQQAQGEARRKGPVVCACAGPRRREQGASDPETHARDGAAAAGFGGRRGGGRGV